MGKNIKYFLLTFLALGFLQLEASAWGPDEDEEILVHREQQKQSDKQLNSLIADVNDAKKSNPKIHQKKTDIEDKNVIRINELAKEIEILEKENHELEAVGDADGQYKIGTQYYNGKDREQNYEKAFRWYTRAANQNHAEAQYKTGLMLSLGIGMEKQDDKKAFKWLLKAANQNNSSAQCMIGNMYYSGKNILETVGDDNKEVVIVAKDKKEAFSWYVKAAEQKDAYAMYMIDSVLSDDILYEILNQELVLAIAAEEKQRSYFEKIKKYNFKCNGYW